MADSKRIAKNTLILYFRMILTMAIGLYSSRILLEQLGVDAYGVYNVVGGIIALVSFLNSAMSGATQRYINFEKGTGHNERLKAVFVSSLIIHCSIGCLLGIIAEIFGPWVLNTYLHIPKDLLAQANWVYQFSVISFIFGIMTVPYLSMIIAYERMSIFAIGAIIEAILKLINALSLYFFLSDKLAIYSFLALMSAIFARLIYIGVCRKKFPECRHLKWKIDKAKIKEMLSFSSWSIVGSFGYILHTQGIAFVINLFFTAAVNAAQGLANQVNGMVQSVIGNFLTALNPQIVQSYAAGDLKTMHSLIYRGSRIAIFLSSILVIPVVLESQNLLIIWLGKVPEYTNGFVRTVLIIGLIGSLTGIMSTAQNATGNIKKYQVVLTSVGLLHVPFAILAFALGGSPLWAVYVYLLISIVLQIIRVNFVCRSVELDKGYMYKDVILRSLIAAIVGCIIPFFCEYYIENSTIITTFAIIFISIFSVAISFYFIAFTQNERNFVFSLIKSRISHVQR